MQLLLIVGAKLEHIITRLAQEAAAALSRESPLSNDTEEAPKIKPSKDHFWFHKPELVLHLIHFILFQNSFEIGYFFWVLVLCITSSTAHLIFHQSDLGANNDHFIGIRRVQFVHDGTEALCHFQTCYRVSESLNCLKNLEHCPVDDKSPC